MKRLIDLEHEEAKKHFLKCSSYFNGDMPSYISFAPILSGVSRVLSGGAYTQFKKSNPNHLSKVNYNFITNKDGRLSWRPYELIHPAIYVSLVNTICSEENWQTIKDRFQDFESGVVECCSAPVMSIDHQKDNASQVLNWWQKVEQQSLINSLEYSHLLHTDVTDCYGSLYTHSIPWALHGIEKAKKKRSSKALLGNKIDAHIQAGRYGQTNGISQGSTLMDFIAEIVLGFIDEQINLELGNSSDIKILRYRDDYRIFSNSDDRAEAVLRVISDKLRSVGMKLGVAKTISCRNVIEGSIKPDKIAGIGLRDLDTSNAKTIQKQLLRLHSFGQKHTNSGALRRLVGEFHTNITKQSSAPDDLEVQIAIATDIALVSPSTFPAIAGVLSHLISLAPSEAKTELWSKVKRKMRKVPYNGYLEIWLQRVIQPKTLGIQFESEESICRIVNGEPKELWDSSWISSTELKNEMDTKKILVADSREVEEVIQPDEVELFKRMASSY